MPAGTCEGGSDLPAVPPGGGDDRDLARALIDGEDWAQRRAWLRFAPMVRGMLRRWFGSGPDVDDLQQDVFAAFFRKVRELRDPTAIQAFVRSIVRITALCEIRNRNDLRRHEAELEDIHWDLALTEQPDLGECRAHAALHAIVDDLSARNGEGFRLRFLEQYDWQQVAETLGVSVATAKRRVARVSKLVVIRVRRSPPLVDHYGSGARRSGSRNSSRAPRAASQAVGF